MPGAEPIPLSDEDRAILALECAAIAGHTCKVVALGGAGVGVEELREAIGSRLPATPELTRKLGGTPERPAWIEAAGFDVADHIRPSALGPAPSSGVVLAEVARLFERLDRDRPLWAIDVVQRPEGGSVLVWRIHHALAGGTAAMRLARELLWDAGPGRPSAVSAAVPWATSAPASRSASTTRATMPPTATPSSRSGCRSASPTRSSGSARSTVRRRSARRRTTPSGSRRTSLRSLAARRSPRLAALVERIEASPREFAVSVSNVPGPRRPVSVLGAPVEGLHSIAEVGLRHGLWITAVSLADRLFFGFNADPDLVDGVDSMAAGVEAEADALIDCG